MIEPSLLVLGLRLTVAVTIVTELLPRTLKLWNLRNFDDGYGVDRIRTWLKSLGMLLIAVFESLIWADYVFAQQTILGSFQERWLLDTAVWSLLLVGSIQVSRLYWTIEWKQGSRSD